MLYPARLPTFHRLAAAAELSDRVRWFWIPEWDIEPGRVARQEVLAFPALNLVVQEESVILAGATTRRSHRDLTGRGWAVGGLLRPAAAGHLCDEPHALLDTEIVIDAPELLERVMNAMATDAAEDSRREDAVAAFSAWIADHVPVPEPDATLANRLEEVIQADRSVTQVDQLADRLGVSARTVQRITRRYVGVGPLAMIRRFRLQEAAERLRTDNTTTIAGVAAELGYADHAHLTADFRAVLGFTPSGYRKSAASSD